MRIDAKQEILDALENGERYSFKHMPAHAENEFARIRAILETHTLEPIDDRPFDPTLCGFVATDFDAWESPRGVIIERCGGVVELSFGATLVTLPWPRNQSDGERLLRLLGVLNG